MNAKRYIYFIQQGDGGPIKVGIATNPIDRIINLQKGSGYELALLGVIEGDRSTEKELHRKFAHLRLRYEWFEAEPALLDFIAENATSWELPAKAKAKTAPPKKTVKEIKAGKGRRFKVSDESLLTSTLLDIQRARPSSDFAAEIGLTGSGLSRIYSKTRSASMNTIHKLSRYGFRIEHPLLLGAIMKHALDLPLTDDQYRRLGERAIITQKTGQPFEMSDILAESDEDFKVK